MATGIPSISGIVYSVSHLDSYESALSSTLSAALSDSSYKNLIIYGVVCVSILEYFVNSEISMFNKLNPGVDNGMSNAGLIGKVKALVSMYTGGKLKSNEEHPTIKVLTTLIKCRNGIVHSGASADEQHSNDGKFQISTTHDSLNILKNILSDSAIAIQDYLNFYKQANGKFEIGGFIIPR